MPTQQDTYDNTSPADRQWLHGQFLEHGIMQHYWRAVATQLHKRAKADLKAIYHAAWENEQALRAEEQDERMRVKRREEGL